MNQMNIIDIKQKMEILKTAQIVLKQEYFGIDSVIDQIIESITPWYIFPQAQENPCVISLWGMTGVGKTSLLNRLMELLDLQKVYYNLNITEYTSHHSSLYSTLEEIYDFHNNKPIVITLDEFQHAKTIDENGKELNSSKSSLIWELIDSGKISMVTFDYKIKGLQDLIKRLEYMVFKGVRSYKGFVCEGQKIYVEKMGIRKINKSIPFIPADEVSDIFSLTKNDYDNIYIFNDFLETLDEKESLEYLHKVFENNRLPKIIDCTKSLVFILGNIDEAYQINRNMNPDISADDFYEFTKKISITKIKNALLSRFRSEQIARLGNRMIIYPSLNSNAYRSLIDTQLQQIAIRFKTLFQLDISFTDAFKAIIYSEGVYPTQGARPILSTIQHLVKSNLNQMIMESNQIENGCDTVILHYHDHHFYFDYFKGGTSVYKIARKIYLDLEKLRTPKKDDFQSIVAVHESGHAILSGVLLRVLPTMILSQTTNANIGGLTSYKIPWNFVSKDEIIKRVAVYLGGYCAEKIVFGDNKVTSGSESDIEKATIFLTDLVKSSGMGSLLAKVSVEDFRANLSVFDKENKLNQQIVNMLNKAKNLAMKTLQNHEELLIMMADQLSDRQRLDENEIELLFLNYADSIPLKHYLTEGQDVYYRQKLKSKVKKLHQETEQLRRIALMPVSLNKNEEEMKIEGGK